MGIKKRLAVLLVFGLLLMGVTPALAAGEQVKAAAPAQQGEVVQVVVPESIELSDEEIGDVQGQWFWAVAGAIIGGYEAYRSCSNCSVAKKAAVTAFGALVGAVGGAYAEAAAVAGEALVQAGRVALGRAVQVGGTAAAGIGSYEAVNAVTNAASRSK